MSRIRLAIGEALAHREYDTEPPFWEQVVEEAAMAVEALMPRPDPGRPPHRPLDGCGACHAWSRDMALAVENARRPVEPMPVSVAVIPAQDVEKILASVEWHQPMTNSYASCPRCGGYRPKHHPDYEEPLEGHRPGCGLAELLMRCRSQKGVQ